MVSSCFASRLGAIFGNNVLILIKDFLTSQIQICDLQTSLVHAVVRESGAHITMIRYRIRTILEFDVF